MRYSAMAFTCLSRNFLLALLGRSFSLSRASHSRLSLSADVAFVATFSGEFQLIDISRRSSHRSNLLPECRFRYSDRGINPRADCVVKSPTAGRDPDLSGLGARKKAPRGIRNCFRLAKVSLPYRRAANPRRVLNGCQSFPVLGLVARRKVSELVRKGRTKIQGPRRRGFPAGPGRYGGDNNAIPGTSVGSVSGL